MDMQGFLIAFIGYLVFVIGAAKDFRAYGHFVELQQD